MVVHRCPLSQRQCYFPDLRYLQMLVLLLVMLGPLVIIDTLAAELVGAADDAGGLRGAIDGGGGVTLRREAVSEEEAMWERLDRYRKRSLCVCLLAGWLQ